MFYRWSVFLFFTKLIFLFNLLSFNSFSANNKDIDEEIESIDLSENNKLTTK